MNCANAVRDVITALPIQHYRSTWIKKPLSLIWESDREKLARKGTLPEGDTQHRHVKAEAVEPGLWRRAYQAGETAWPKT